VGANSGALRWSYYVGGQLWSSPTLDASASLVYVGSSTGEIHAITHNSGRFVWKRKLGGPVYSSPAVDVDGVLYIGCDDFHVYALSGVNGSVVWKANLNGKVRSSPAITADGRVIVGSFDGKLYSIGSGGFSDNVCLHNDAVRPYSSVDFTVVCASGCQPGSGSEVLADNTSSSPLLS